MIASLRRFAQNLVVSASDADDTAAASRKMLVQAGLALATLIGLVGARVCLVNYASTDYDNFLSPWFDAIAAAPWRHALTHSQANYFPPYLYLIFFVSRLPLAKLVGLKLICWMGDAFLGYSVFRVARAAGQNPRPALFLTATVLAVPTVLFDSAMWCQTDAIYCGLLLLALAAGSLGRGWSACAFFASALAFKMQAVFFAPVLVLLLCMGRLRLAQLTVIPLVHFAWMLPSLVLGASLTDTYGTFVTQANFYHQLQMNAPSLYQFIPQIAYEEQSGAGIFMALAVIALALLHATSMPSTGRNTLFAWSSFFVMFVPFVLPKMHDRYFFVANVFSIVLACVVRLPSAALAAVLCNLGSLIAYAPFLFRNTPVPLAFASFAMLCALAQTWWLARTLSLEATS